MVRVNILKRPHLGKSSRHVTSYLCFEESHLVHREELPRKGKVVGKVEKEETWVKRSKRSNERHGLCLMEYSTKVRERA